MINEILDIEYNNNYRFTLKMNRDSPNYITVKLVDNYIGRETSFTSIADAHKYALAVGNMDDIEEAIYFRNNYERERHYV